MILMMIPPAPGDHPNPNHHPLLLLQFNSTVRLRDYLQTLLANPRMLGAVQKTGLKSREHGFSNHEAQGPSQFFISLVAYLLEQPPNLHTVCFLNVLQKREFW
uniref:Uncharacterized protein n=1 Tax=Rhizophora mucronata TaxID=61149 RepID=A0A2P2LUJ3_RHIMU